MPNMNNFELCHADQVGRCPGHPPVLMVTPEAKKEDIVTAAQAGAIGLSSSPFTKATLEEKVNKIIEK